MRVLVLGGDGMLGHELVRAWRERHEVHATFRLDWENYRHHGIFESTRSHCGLDVRNPQDVLGVIADVRPDAVVNAVGIVKQRETAKEAIPSLEINALFPHRLAQLCRAARARMVHLSTDCVFSGGKGAYTEDDLPDASDLYGRTKLLGEVSEPNCLTLRTSIIGLELSRRKSLVEWYLAQRGSIRGFRRAIYTGLTTAEMARAIEHFLVREPALSGRWHLASQPISKYDLLEQLGELLGRKDVQLEPDDDFVCDRSLDSSALAARTQYRVPSWSVMLQGLAADIRERNRLP
jgi:dTDP-4-dehydrorhamnose reductase